MFQVCFKGISRLFQGYFKGVLDVPRVFQWCCLGVSRDFQGGFKGVAKVLHFCFKCDSRVSFEEVSRISQG